MQRSTTASGNRKLGEPRNSAVSPGGPAICASRTARFTEDGRDTKFGGRPSHRRSHNHPQPICLVFRATALEFAPPADAWRIRQTPPSDERGRPRPDRTTGPIASGPGRFGHAARLALSNSDRRGVLGAMQTSGVKERPC